MTDANSRQFKSLDSIEFVQALTPETAANYSGGACTFADTTSTFRARNQEPSFNSNNTREDLELVRSLYNSGVTPFIDFETWSEL